MGILRVLKAKGETLPTDDNGPMVYIPSWLFMVICSAVVGARVWSRKITSGGLGPDDYTIIASLVFAIASYAVALWGYYSGYGKHGVYLTKHQQIESLKSFYIGQITYKISLSLTKSSILFLYLRIFGNVKWLRRTCYVLLVLIALYYTAATLVTILQCIPVAAAFDKNITSLKCISLTPFWYTNAVISIATDLIILIIPIPLICALQMSRPRKAALIFVFALGTFVVITSALRFTTLDIPVTSPDPLYHVDTEMWTLIEMSMAIVCACLPQIRSLATNLLFPKVKSAYRSLRSKLSFVEPDDNHQQTSDREEERWTHIGSQNDVKLTNVICTGDADAEITSAHRNDRKTKILKTVDYTLEYSESGPSS
ncbi:putative PTH11-typeG-protein-coupled receptor [Xylaria flabelliformis]|nr:putative PTH11-typeG-protein-coupled receptor [Xylaria flabelliformis]